MSLAQTIKIPTATHEPFLGLFTFEASPIRSHAFLTNAYPLVRFINDEFAKGVEDKLFEIIDPHKEKFIVAVGKGIEIDIEFAV